jgi:hypothetical protein
VIGKFIKYMNEITTASLFMFFGESASESLEFSVVLCIFRRKITRALIGAPMFGPNLDPIRPKFGLSGLKNGAESTTETTAVLVLRKWS